MDSARAARAKTMQDSHCKADVFGFIKIFRNFARLEGIHGAGNDEEHVVHQADPHGGRADATLEDGKLSTPHADVFLFYGRRVFDDPGRDKDELHAYKTGTDDDLRFG